MTTGEAKHSKWLDQIFELHKGNIVQCLYNAFACLMTYLTQLTHQNIIYCSSPEGATLTITIMLD